MKILKIIFITLATLITVATVPVAQVAAAGTIPVCATGGVATNTDVCQKVNSQGTDTNPIISIIKIAITIISYVIGVLAIIFIMVSAIRLITAGGDAQAAASARSGLIYALIGIAIAIMAQVIVDFVLNKVQ